MSFFDLDDLGQNLHAAGIDNRSIAANLARIINHPDPKIALGGLKEQRERVREALELNGVISHVGVSQRGPDGRQSITTARILNRLHTGGAADRAALDTGSQSIARFYEPEALPSAVHDPGDEDPGTDYLETGTEDRGNGGGGEGGGEVAVEGDDERPLEHGPDPEPPEQCIPGA